VAPSMKAIPRASGVAGLSATEDELWLNAVDVCRERTRTQTAWDVAFTWNLRKKHLMHWFANCPDYLMTRTLKVTAPVAWEARVIALPLKVTPQGPLYGRFGLWRALLSKRYIARWQLQSFLIGEWDEMRAFRSR
jgi:hypothetical protein